MTISKYDGSQVQIYYLIVCQTIGKYDNYEIW